MKSLQLFTQIPLTYKNILTCVMTLQIFIILFLFLVLVSVFVHNLLQQYVKINY